MIDVMSAAFNQALRNRLIGIGAEPVGGTPEELGRHLTTELARWAEVVRMSGARID